MSYIAIALLCLGAALLALFVVCAISVVAGIRRRGRAAGASAGTGSLPMLLALSFGLTVNVLSVAAATLWYRLRGKPLPPPR